MRDNSVCIDEVKVELIEKLTEIIHLQSDCIDDLFKLLCQHLTAEELDGLPVLSKINDAAQIRAEIDF